VTARNLTSATCFCMSSSFTSSSIPGTEKATRLIRACSSVVVNVFSCAKRFEIVALALWPRFYQHVVLRRTVTLKRCSL
jgi:hypothetical protein